MNCPECGGTRIVGVEVRGASDGAIIWSCSECGHSWPRFTEGPLNLMAKALIWQWQAQRQDDR